MRATQGYLAATLLGLAAVLTPGCHDSTEPAVTATGAIEITVSTAGETVDIDPDGYTLSIDGGRGRAVAVNAAVTIGALPRGKHLVRLDGLAPNCSVDGASVSSVEVITDAGTSRVSFSVSCGPTSEGGGWDY